MTPLAQQVHAALPQTQCTRCGYPDCEGYAEAIASSEAAINQCPPGGMHGVIRLASITGREARPLNPANGVEGPRTVAVIDENWCIGCTLCIEVCPTDAILGTNKRMHTVIDPHCTGCELCVPVCPVDCISLENVTGERTGWDAWSQPLADEALERYEWRRQRLSPGSKAREKLANLAELTKQAEGPELDRKRAVIEAALARARAQRR